MQAKLALPFGQWLPSASSHKTLGSNSRFFLTLTVLVFRLAGQCQSENESSKQKNNQVSPGFQPGVKNSATPLRGKHFRPFLADNKHAAEY